MADAWFVYVLRCSDGSLYTGVATDIERRLEEHNAGRGAKYTRGRTPVALVYRERCADRSRAQQREVLIKRMKRADKLRLIAARSL
ncbi:MAG TPA: GIY-YIG nuclease family protein [Arenicellales bacterium]|nr:GIY-YIG nuclease family protein [Arenicellales bacterium]